MFEDLTRRTWTASVRTTAKQHFPLFRTRGRQEHQVNSGLRISLSRISKIFTTAILLGLSALGNSHQYRLRWIKTIVIESAWFDGKIRAYYCMGYVWDFIDWAKGLGFHPSLPSLASLQGSFLKNKHIKLSNRSLAKCSSSTTAGLSVVNSMLLVYDSWIWKFCSFTIYIFDL